MKKLVLFRETALHADEFPSHDDDVDLYLKLGQRAACVRCAPSEEGAVRVEIQKNSDIVVQHWKLADGYTLQKARDRAGRPSMRVLLSVKKWFEMRKAALKTKLSIGKINKKQHDEALAKARELVKAEG